MTTDQESYTIYTKERGGYRIMKLEKQRVIQYQEKEIPEYIMTIKHVYDKAEV